MIVFRRICIFVILSLLVFTSVWHYFKVKNAVFDITRSMYSLKALYFQNADSIYSVLYEIKWSVSNMVEMQKINLGNLF